jgi:hypothetical protein
LILSASLKCVSKQEISITSGSKLAASIPEVVYHWGYYGVLFQKCRQKKCRQKNVIKKTSVSRQKKW